MSLSLRSYLTTPSAALVTPWMIALVLSSRLATAQGTRPPAGAAVAPAPAAQPVSDLQIDIEEPKDWSQTTTISTRGLVANVKSSIRVSGTARFPGGIQDVLLNKNRASLAELPDGSMQFVGYVRVEEKMTAAEITVIGKTGVRQAVHYNITPVEPPKPEATPEAAWSSKVAQAGFHGKRWAVIIGISNYEDKAFPSLKYADADAKAFYEFLRSPLAGMGGFDPANITILLNEQATYTAMRVALFDFLKNATADDIVYIYFAGHGTPDPQRLNNMYLLPYNAKATSIGGTAFPMEDMSKALRQVSAAHKILITDACHTGSISTGATRGLGVNEINAAFLDHLGSSSGVYIAFTASGDAEESEEGDQWGGGHGVFTHYLLEGLAGAADRDGDHIVDLHEMVDYTRENVERATSGAQHPSTGNSAYDEAFPVALVLPDQPIKTIPLEEIRAAGVEKSITDKADLTPWTPPDSAVLVAGMPDTLRVRLVTPDREIVPGTWLTWSSSNPMIANVNASGIVSPVAGGTVTISAARGGRKVDVMIQVLPRPSDVSFYPADSNLTLVQSETIKVHADLLIGSAEWHRDMAPRTLLSDTLALRQEPGLEFVATRLGMTTLTATIGGRTRTWTIHVIPPSLKIKPIPVASPINGTLTLDAWRTRPDGTVLGDAVNVEWKSLDSTRAVIRDGSVVARAIGRARFVGTLGNASDTVSTFVLGDLLVGVDGHGGPNVATLGLATGNPISLLPPGTNGSEPALSPKGDRIAFVSNKRLYIMDPDGSNIRRFTPDMKGLLGMRLSSYEEHSPSWTNDGSRVEFISNAPGNYEVLSISADGKDVQQVTKTAEAERNVSTAPDEPHIAFERATAFDNSDVYVALIDGSQPQLVPAVQSADRHFSQVKPKFLGGSDIVVVRKWPGRDGESLHLLSTAGATTRDLVHEERDHSLVYAVSPDGEYIAYHRVADWGDNNSLIVIIDRTGTLLKTINLGKGVEIKNLGWGASLPAHPKEGK